MSARRRSVAMCATVYPTCRSASSISAPRTRDAGRQQRDQHARRRLDADAAQRACHTPRSSRVAPSGVPVGAAAGLDHEADQRQRRGDTDAFRRRPRAAGRRASAPFARDRRARTAERAAYDQRAAERAPVSRSRRRRRWRSSAGGTALPNRGSAARESCTYALRRIREEQRAARQTAAQRHRALEVEQQDDAILVRWRCAPRACACRRTGARGLPARCAACRRGTCGSSPPASARSGRGGSAASPCARPLCGGMWAPGDRMEKKAVSIPGTFANSRAVSGHSLQLLSAR